MNTNITSLSPAANPTGSQSTAANRSSGEAASTSRGTTKKLDGEVYVSVGMTARSNVFDPGPNFDLSTSNRAASVTFMRHDSSKVFEVPFVLVRPENDPGKWGDGIVTAGSDNETIYLEALLTAKDRGIIKDDSAFLEIDGELPSLWNRSLAEQVLPNIKLSPGQEMFREHFEPVLEEDFLQYLNSIEGDLSELIDRRELAALLTTRPQSHNAHYLDLTSYGTKNIDARNDYGKIEISELSTQQRSSLTRAVTEKLSEIIGIEISKELPIISAMVLQLDAIDKVAELEQEATANPIANLGKFAELVADSDSSRGYLLQLNNSLSHLGRDIVEEKSQALEEATSSILSSEEAPRISDVRNYRASLIDSANAHSDLLSELLAKLPRQLESWDMKKVGDWHKEITEQAEQVKAKVSAEDAAKIDETLSEVSSTISQSFAEAVDARSAFVQDVLMTRFTNSVTEFVAKPSYDAFEQILHSADRVQRDNGWLLIESQLSPEPSSVNGATVGQMLDTQRFIVSNIESLERSIQDGEFGGYQFTEQEQARLDSYAEGGMVYLDIQTILGTIEERKAN